MEPALGKQHTVGMSGSCGDAIKFLYINCTLSYALTYLLEVCIALGFRKICFLY